MDPIAKRYLNRNTKKEIPKEDSPYDHMEDVNTIIVSSHGDREQKENHEIEVIKNKINESFTVPNEPEPFSHTYTHDDEIKKILIGQKEKSMNDAVHESSDYHHANYMTHDFYRFSGDHKKAQNFMNNYAKNVNPNIFSLHRNEYPTINGDVPHTEESKKLLVADDSHINDLMMNNDVLSPEHIEHIKGIIHSHPVNSSSRLALQKKYDWFMQKHSDKVVKGENKDLFMERHELKSAFDKGLYPSSGRIFRDKIGDYHHLNKDGTFTQVNHRTWETEIESDTHPIVSAEKHEENQHLHGILYAHMTNEFKKFDRPKLKGIINYTEDSRELNRYLALKNLGHHKAVENMMGDNRIEEATKYEKDIDHVIKNHDHFEFPLTVHHGVSYGFDPSYDLKSKKLVPITDDRTYWHSPENHESMSIAMTQAKKYLGDDHEVLGIHHLKASAAEQNEMEVSHMHKVTGEVSRPKFRVENNPDYQKPEHFIGHLPAYTSTSTDINIAESFSKYRKDRDLDKEVRDVLSLKIPAKYKHGIYVEPITSNRGESEYVLGKNHLIKYHTEPKYYMRNGVIYRHWNGEVIPKKDEE